MQKITLSLAVGYFTLAAFSPLGAEAIPAQPEAPPQAGQTVSDFQKSVRSSLAEQGDRMGFGLQLCPLRPSFYPNSETYLARAFSQRADTVITLIGVEQGRVTHWQEFDLPDLDGWITHYVTRCQGATLKIGQGRSAQFYKWNGTGFLKVK
ncbi:hypothetical protein [Methylobacterium sp. P1-11]|uniref:hypothetical protein n=1 Tax=Methylobacterium sp. P1-11 TaxID=2024616 RepID=UPI0011ED824E|nr:hypothetical protein [Methylobacterium sp. P1-11]